MIATEVHLPFRSPQSHKVSLESQILRLTMPQKKIKKKITWGGPIFRTAMRSFLKKKRESFSRSPFFGTVWRYQKWDCQIAKSNSKGHPVQQTRNYNYVYLSKHIDPVAIATSFTWTQKSALNSAAKKTKMNLNRVPKMEPPGTFQAVFLWLFFFGVFWFWLFVCFVVVLFVFFLLASWQLIGLCTGPTSV